MVIIWWDNILWWRKNKSLRFKLDDGENFLSSLFDMTWLILAVKTPHHGPKV